MSQSYYLGDMTEILKKEDQRKLSASDSRINNLKLGDRVSLIFTSKWRVLNKVQGDGMWVDITEIDDGKFKGSLVNQPNYVINLAKGDVVEFSKENIVTISAKQNFAINKKALISKIAALKREVNRAYRDAPVPA